MNTQCTAESGGRTTFFYGLLVCLTAPWLFSATISRGIPMPRWPVESLTPTVSLVRGPVNGLLINRNGKALAIYGYPASNPPAVEQVLFTHHRRDVAWAGVELVQHGAKAVIPVSEANLFLHTDQFWERYWTNRFHDYKVQSSRILTESLPAAISIQGGDTHEWEGLSIQVLDTPGYTRGAVSYLFQLDGQRIACVGDLIYGDGQILDLFSLQDAIAEIREDGYHGYAARAAEVITSLRKIEAWKPDLLVPAHGPAIAKPSQAIDKLSHRLQTVFASHFANDALRWYRGDDRLSRQAARILGNREVQWMPVAETVQSNLPNWMVPILNSRLILSESGAAFMADCGGRRHLQEVKKLQQQGRFKTLEGLYITHYHDDHTDQAQAVVDEFHCPVYACRELRDVLEHPGAYRLPALTRNPITHVEAMAEGETRHWHEFELTYTYFPGQTIYHGGLRVKKDGSETLFFIGDSFGPTGMDDYCLLNRNFFAPEKGYSYCLDVLRKLKPDYLLVNQHIEPVFRFSAAQLDSMSENFRKRKGLLAELFPWDDANFGMDEQWVRFYPYGSEVRVDESLELRLILLNHSPRKQKFEVKPRLPAGWSGPENSLHVTIGPRQEGFVRIPVTPPPGWHGLAVIKADVGYGSWSFPQITEALVLVK